MKSEVIKIVSGACIVVALFSCNSENDSAAHRENGFTPAATREDSLNHDIMEGHDVAMARMSKLDDYLAKTKHALDSVEALPNEKLDILFRDDLISIQRSLDSARLSMNAWMDGFKPDSAEQNKEVHLKYLESEREKVMKMKNMVLSSLQRADSMFRK